MIIKSLIAGVSFAVIISFTACSPSPQAISDDWNLKTLDGQDFNLSEARGKILFLNIWATWCGPCIAEMPSLQALYNHYNDNEDIVFAFVSVDEDNGLKSRFDLVKEFISSRSYTLPVYLSEGNMPKMFDIWAIPTTFIIDKDGNVIKKQVGEENWNTQEVFDFIDSLK